MNSDDAPQRGGKDALRDFLVSRRARITPEQAGLPVYGSNRRVTGLRREEVAILAGISVEYYTKLERGSAAGASEAVLDGLVHALALDEAERDHLFRLVRHSAGRGGARRSGAPRRSPQRRVRPTIQRILDLLPTPAYVRNGRFDVLGANALGRALYAPVYDQADGAEQPNTARFVFLDPAAADFFLDHDQVRDDAVAYLQAEAGRDPYDRALSDLIGELSTRSDDFRVRWATHDVKYHRTGRKRLHHPLVGDLELDFEALEAPGDPGQRINVYTAAPDSPAIEALALLASWTLPAAGDTDAATGAATGNVVERSAE